MLRRDPPTRGHGRCTTKTTYRYPQSNLTLLSLHHDLADPLRLARAFKKYLSSQTMHLYRRAFPEEHWRLTRQGDEGDDLALAEFELRGRVWRFIAGCRVSREGMYLKPRAETVTEVIDALSAEVRYL